MSCSSWPEPHTGEMGWVEKTKPAKKTLFCSGQLDHKPHGFLGLKPCMSRHLKNFIFSSEVSPDGGYSSNYGRKYHL